MLLDDNWCKVSYQSQEHYLEVIGWVIYSTFQFVEIFFITSGTLLNHVNRGYTYLFLISRILINREGAGLLVDLPSRVTLLLKRTSIAPTTSTAYKSKLVQMKRGCLVDTFYSGLLTMRPVMPRANLLTSLAWPFKGRRVTLVRRRFSDEF